MVISEMNVKNITLRHSKTFLFFHASETESKRMQRKRPVQSVIELAQLTFEQNEEQ